MSYTYKGNHSFSPNSCSLKKYLSLIHISTGAIEAIVSVLTLRDGMIPPTIHLNEQDEELDLNLSLIHI